MSEYDDYKVGYRNPPVGTRFQPGKSGNPAGRKKVADAVETFETFLQKFLWKKVNVVEDGKRKRISKYEAVVIRLINQAATGNSKCLRLVIDALEGGLRKKSPREKKLEKENMELKEKLEPFIFSGPITDAERQLLLDASNERLAKILEDAFALSEREK